MYIKQDKVTEPNEVTHSSPTPYHWARTEKSSGDRQSIAVRTSSVICNDMHQLQTVLYNKRTNYIGPRGGSLGIWNFSFLSNFHE